MDSAWDTIDAFYDGTFDQAIKLGTDATEYRGIVSRVDGPFEIVEAGQKKTRKAQLRVRRSELETAPEVRSKVTVEDGTVYRVTEVDRNSTANEFLIQLEEDR
jgi:hypothetical protein